MKKLFTFAVAVLASMAMMAQTTVFNWSPTESECVGSVLFGTADFSVAKVKIHTNTDEISALKCGSTYKYADNKYISIKPAEGTFQAGDVVSLSVCYNNSAEKNALVVIYAADGSTLLYTSGFGINGRLSNDDPVLETYTLTADADSLLLGRGSGSNLTTTYMPQLYVTRPETRQIVSQTESLFNAKVNGEVMSIDDFADLLTSQDLQMDAEYVTAPVVTFVKQIVTNYDDQSSDVDYVDIDVTAEVDAEFPQLWAASATINNILYRVRMHIAASHTVTYMYGEEVLGTETVGHGDHPAEYAQYETMTLATFGGWYSNEELSEEVTSMNEEVINADATYYADFTINYVTGSVNIEQLVLDHGKKYDIQTALTAAGWEYANLNDLDSLNDDKTARNEPYLGLKLKTAGAYVRCRLQVGDDQLYIKFGNVGCDVKLNLKGATVNLEVTYTKDQLAAVDNIIGVFGQPEDVVVTITTTAASTVVLKQLMLGAIEEVVLPTATAIDNAAVTEQATKRIVNGQVIILRDGKTYNALGTEVR